MTIETSTLPRTGGEGSPDYAQIIHIHGKHRVVLCRHKLQWIIQRAAAKDLSSWKGVRFYQTRKALLRDWDALTNCAPRGILPGLPEHITPERA